MFKREERAAFGVLVDELGLVRALKVGGRLQRKRFAGEPFGDLPPPEDEDERLSREQIGPAIVLYRQLQRDLSQDRAYEITERVVIEGSIHFLARTIGRLPREELVLMEDDEREEFVRERGREFFNATIEWDRISETAVEFTVTHCEFPDLCEAAGVPELAPVFCEGDGEFFGGVESDVELERPHTIAQGGPNCPFRISLRDPD